MKGFGDYEEDELSSTLQKRDHKGHTDLIIENISTEQTHPCITKQISEQSGQDLGQPGALVIGEVKEIPFTKSGFGDYKEGTGTLKKDGGDLGGGSETLIVGQ